ncbi:MAG: response regulator [Pseudomonadota bacterium]
MASSRITARSAAVIVGLTIAVLIGAAALIAITHANSAARQQRLVVGSYEMLGLIRQVVIALQDAEIGQRAYLLSGRASDLEGAERSRLRLDTGLRQLEAAVADDPDTMRQVEEFRRSVTEKLDQINLAISTFQLHGREAALALERTGAGRATTDRIRQIADEFIEGQRLLLAQRLAALHSEQQQSDVAALLLMGGALLCLLIGMFLAVRAGWRLEDVQRDLAGRSQLLQAILESLHEPIFVIDADGAVVAWNEPFVRLSGWEPARHGHLTRAQLLSERFPAMRALLKSLALEAQRGKAPVTVRASFEGRDYDVSRGEMAGGGSVVRCVDITEKLRDELALRQGQKMEATGQLTGGMAHDFNNILQVIQANLDLVKGVVTDRQVLARLGTAAAAADRGARLTQQLLAFARRQSLAPQPTDVAQLVRDLADLLRHSLGERIIFRLEIADEPWNAKIDPSQLENAILNLAINARDAMPEGGTVTIEVSNAMLDRRYAALHPEVTPGPYVLVAVNDTGVGMPPEVAAQAFDPFFTTKEDGKGTGLGLSMVYGFVRQSNGHIRIDSAIGQGTSIKLYLPRTLDPVPVAADQADDVSIGSERVLVVEDNDEVRRAVVDMLSGWGYRPVAAENPDVAAAILEKDQNFDLLFTDIVMPGSLSAIELAAYAQGLQPRMAVLLTSGYARDLIPAQGRSDYPLIAKPYRGDELRAKIRAVLSAHRPVQPAEGPEEAEARDSGEDAGRPRRVLLVEDEVVLRMSTTDMLERLGCFVSGVGSGEQALELLAEGGAFDLLLTDLGLPGMSGEQLATEVRHRFPGLPVIIASGYGRSGVQGGSGVMDGLQFISKPYSSIDLQQALEHAARNIAAN